MSKDLKSLFGKLSLVTQSFTNKKTAFKLDRQIDEMQCKSARVACQLQAQINELDDETFPASAKVARYRWERLIKDLDDLSNRLEQLKSRLHNNRVRTALKMMDFDLWPLTFKISCRHEIETGVQGDWISSMNKLYALCESYAEQVDKASTLSSISKKSNGVSAYWHDKQRCCLHTVSSEVSARKKADCICASEREKSVPSQGVERNDVILMGYSKRNDAVCSGDSESGEVVSLRASERKDAVDDGGKLAS